MMFRPRAVEALLSNPPNRRRRLFQVLIAALVVAVALLPQLLATSALRPVLERILGARAGFSVAIEDATLTWRGPQSVRGCAIASAEGFGDEPLFAAESIHVDGSLWSLLTLSTPSEIRLERPALTVIRAPGGTSNLDRWLERNPSPADGAWPRIEVHGGRARIEDRSLPPEAARLDADGIELTHMRDAIALRARVADGPTVGRLVVESSTAADGARSNHVEAYALDLGRLDPLLRPWLPAGTRCAGRADLEFTARRRPDGFVEFDGAGRVVGLEFPSAWLTALGAPLALGPGVLADPQLAFEGRVAFDSIDRSGSFERFAFHSTFFEIEANGSIGIPDAAPPLELRASVNFDYLERRGAPLLGTTLPFLGGSGHVAIEVAELAKDTYRVVGRGERATFVVSGGTRFQWPATTIETTARVDHARGAVSWSETTFETRGGTLTGGLEWRGAEDFDATLHWIGDWEPVESFIAQWNFGTFWDGGGEFDATAHWSCRGNRTSLALEIASTDLALQFSPREGNFVIDDYFFRGSPFTAKVTAEFDPLAARSSWSGSVVVDASGAVIRDDTFADLAIAAKLEGGVVSIERCEGSVHDGRFRAGGTIRLHDDADAEMEFEFEGRDLALGGHTSEWSGQICPVFATKGGPYRVQGTPRLTGSIAVTGTGYGLRSLARTASGQGHMTWTGGTLAGSDLLALVATDAPTADGVRIDSITSEVRLENARVYARSIVAMPGRQPLVIDGSANWIGQYEFHVDAESLVPPAVFERHRAALDGRRFVLRGNSGRPQFDLPDLRRWLELDARGELGPELERLPPR